MSDMKWTDIVVALAAIYAALLSTYNFISDWLNKRAHAKVLLSHGFITGPIEAKLHVLMTVRNTGHIPVTVRSITLVLPDGRKMFVPQLGGEQVLPCELTTGQSTTFWILARALSRSLKESGLARYLALRAECTDGTGRVYRSRKLNYDVEAWLNED